MAACLEDGSLKEQTALLVFLNHCFNSMEVDLIRDQVKRLVSLSMWVSLQPVSCFKFCGILLCFTLLIKMFNFVCRVAESKS
jgi:hypothetical protein